MNWLRSGAASTIIRFGAIFGTRMKTQQPPNWRWRHLFRVTMKNWKKQQSTVPLLCSAIVTGGIAGGYVLDFKLPEFPWTKKVSESDDPLLRQCRCKLNQGVDTGGGGGGAPLSTDASSHSNTSGPSEGILFGLGSPLLDISALVDLDFLEKYHLQPNNAVLATEEHLPMYQELVNNFSVRYIAGGSGQNTLRVAQWLLKTPNATTFMGAVGNDEFSHILEDSATNDGVNVRYQRLPDLQTGTCAVLITGTHRSLCAHLAAADNFSKEFLLDAVNFSLVEKAEVYYIEGFFLTSSPESIQEIADHAAKNNKCFTMNLSASFIPRLFTDRLMSVMPFVDILFGNETEAAALAEVENYDTTDLGEIGKRIVALPKDNACRPRIVIITQGDGPVVVVQGSDVQEFPVEKLDPEMIKDTNGAGDAFCGGFLAKYIEGKTVKECVKCGIWAATEVIQRSGFTFPKDKSYPG